MNIKAWIHAFRLRTLPLAFSCILMGAFLAVPTGTFDTGILLLSLLTTLFLQILSNLANDYGDATSGVDGDHREGPQRAVQSGAISKEAMKRALYVFSFLALLCGILLILYAFPDNWETSILFLLIGLAAIGAAINYTVGKNPYGYKGFGDLFVLIFFGFVGVIGSYYLYSESWTPDITLPAISCGLLAVGVLNVNNIRDIESDRRSGKISIPVRLGRRGAILYHWGILFVAFAAAVLFGVLRGFTSYDWIFLVTGALLFANARAVYRKTTAQELDPYLKQLALTTLLFVLLMGFALA